MCPLFGNSLVALVEFFKHLSPSLGYGVCLPAKAMRSILMVLFQDADLHPSIVWGLRWCNLFSFLKRHVSNIIYLPPATQNMVKFINCRNRGHSGSRYTPYTYTLKKQNTTMFHSLHNVPLPPGGAEKDTTRRRSRSRSVAASAPRATPPTSPG